MGLGKTAAIVLAAFVIGCKSPNYSALKVDPDSWEEIEKERILNIEEVGNLKRAVEQNEKTLTRNLSYVNHGNYGAGSEDPVRDSAYTPIRTKEEAVRRILYDFGARPMIEGFEGALDYIGLRLRWGRSKIRGLGGRVLGIEFSPDNLDGLKTGVEFRKDGEQNGYAQYVRNW